MKIQVAFTADIPRAAPPQVYEWLDYVLGRASSIPPSNPLADKKLEADGIAFKIEYVGG